MLHLDRPPAGRVRKSPHGLKGSCSNGRPRMARKIGSPPMFAIVLVTTALAAPPALARSCPRRSPPSGVSVVRALGPHALEAFSPRGATGMGALVRLPAGVQAGDWGLRPAAPTIRTLLGLAPRPWWPSPDAAPGRSRRGDAPAASMLDVRRSATSTREARAPWASTGRASPSQHRRHRHRRHPRRLPRRVGQNPRRVAARPLLRPARSAREPREHVRTDGHDGQRAPRRGLVGRRDRPGARRRRLALAGPRRPRDARGLVRRRQRRRWPLEVRGRRALGHAARRPHHRRERGHRQRRHAPRRRLPDGPRRVHAHARRREPLDRHRLRAARRDHDVGGGPREQRRGGAPRQRHRRGRGQQRLDRRHADPPERARVAGHPDAGSGADAGSRRERRRPDLGRHPRPRVVEGGPRFAERHVDRPRRVQGIPSGRSDQKAGIYNGSQAPGQARCPRRSRTARSSPGRASGPAAPTT